ncbi:hypothetical protein BGZ82_010471 [Podila clonocystis]|nr:hypothetical protein BGZ82_010471 [Podila clonocystis]
MELIKAADELCMEDLLHGCERHALTTICRDNVLDLVHLASQHNLSQLKAECLDFIASNIDHLKKGKPILALDADILKDILSMDQLDLEEIEIWKIAVRWAYYQQGLDWAQCPALDFPRGSGCVLIQTFTEEETSGYHLGDDDDGDDYDELDDARVPLGGTNIHISGLGDDEDGFRPPAHQLPLPKLTLQYRATRDGFDAGNFHMACDQRGPTLTVVRADNGAVFGGYNSSSWSSHPSGVYSTSKTNFLFTLKSREHPTRENMRFDVKGDGNAAAYNKADFGPTFGVGHDLYLASNCNLTCQSSSTMPSSYNGPGASTAALAGSFYFRVSEVEVFLVQSATSASP